MYTHLQHAKQEHTPAGSRVRWLGYIYLWFTIDLWLEMVFAVAVPLPPPIGAYKKPQFTDSFFPGPSSLWAV